MSSYAYACALPHRLRAARRLALVLVRTRIPALDPAGVVLLRDLVQDVAREGTAVLVSSHHLDEVARVADRVEVMHRGRLVGELPPDGADLEHAFFEMVHAADNDTIQSAKPHHGSQGVA